MQSENQRTLEGLGSKEDIQKSDSWGNVSKDSKNNEKNAEYFAKKQKEISIAEFFEKNRHLLGFDSKRKVLLTAVKEAVDNSLDACEEARILPELKISLIQMSSKRFRVIVEDNGPGIVKKQMPKIFGKLLYGSKFHSMKQHRGQQGIGISAVALYGQLTTGKPIKITSKIASSDRAFYCELFLDTTKNEPQILKDDVVDSSKDHGTKIEIELEGSYYQGSQSVDEFIKQVAIVNPHVNITYVNPKAEYLTFARATETLPVESKEIKPHPYGIEVGTLAKMLSSSTHKTLVSFLKNEFSRVSAAVADEILTKASILPETDPKSLDLNQVHLIINAIRDTKIMAPPVDCLSPIGEKSLELGLKKEVNAEFYCVTSRSPSVYSGNPFIIEVGFAYGGNLPKDSSAAVLRFANKVPLLYQAGACALTKSVLATNWKRYSMMQPKGSLPIGPLVILIHIASVWVPYTNEAKEAVANYDEIIKEVKLSFQELGRKLNKYVNKKKNVKDELLKRDFIAKFIPYISESLREILGFPEEKEKELNLNLAKILEKKRGTIDTMEFDESSNQDYDENLKLKVKRGIVDDFYNEDES